MTYNRILKTIYPSVVTFMGDWRKMMRDVKQLGISEISLFLTAADFFERKKIILALEKTKVRKIPHVHARHDFREQEFDYFIRTYKTGAFTMHYPYIKYIQNLPQRKKIFIENNYKSHRVKKMSELKKVGGACIDLSHLVHFKNHNPKDYALTKEMAHRFRIGCNHISAVKSDGYSWHQLKNVKELDYLADIPKEYFSNNLNIELINSIPEQLRYREYIAKLITKAWK